jgi:ATP-binding cassette subfamily F protein uup
MEGAILAAEDTLARRQAAAGDPAIATRADELAARCRELREAEEAVERLYARWAELELKRG